MAKLRHNINRLKAALYKFFFSESPKNNKVEKKILLTVSRKSRLSTKMCTAKTRSACLPGSVQRSRLSLVVYSIEA